MSDRSPVCEAIGKTIDILNIHDRIALFSYKDPEHFVFLWNLLNKEAFSLTGKCNTIVIVWDDIPPRATPSDAVNVGRYLTPLDWAVGFSLKHYLNFVCEPKLDLTILIVDTISGISVNTDSVRFFSQFYKMKIAVLPWVRFYEPGSLNGAWSIDNLFLNIITLGSDAKSRGIGSMGDDNLIVPSSNTSSKDLGSFLEVLKGYWAANITRPSTPGDQHVIANIVGPLLLMEEEGVDPQITALQILMRQLDLLPQKNEKGGRSVGLLKPSEHWIDLNAEPWRAHLKNAIEGDDRSLELILIDDMFEAGWGRLLCLATNTTYMPLNPESQIDKGPTRINDARDDKVSIWASKSADWLLAKLKSVVEHGPRDARFSLFLNDGGGDHLEILFLDLRLFAGKSLNEEVKFFKALLDTAKEVAKWRKLPWPPITEQEIERIEAWFELEGKEREDDAYIDALTLLPRLIALMDMSLPIVVFSSTGRRDIIEMLKKYGNIITDFDKPRFTVDIPRDIGPQTRLKFQRAMWKAISILQGRGTCRRVRKLARGAQHLQGLVGDPSFSHIEIYLDETGSAEQPTFSLGGIVALYPDYDAVKKLSDGLRGEGIYWCTPEPSDRQHLSKKPGKQNRDDQGACANTTWTYPDVWERFMAACQSNHVTIVGICGKEAVTKNFCLDDRHFPLRDVSAENRYTRAFYLLMELSLFELLPTWAAKKNKVSVSVFAGTRTPPLSLGQDVLDRDHSPWDYFGYHKTPFDRDRYYTVSESSIVDLMRKVLHHRNDMPDSVTIHHTRGVVYWYGIDRRSNRYIWKNMPAQSYFADVALAWKDGLKHIFDAGFDIELDDNIQLLLDAQEYALDDDLPSAILSAACCTEPKDPIHGHLLWKVDRILDELDGDSFLALCNAEPFKEKPFVKREEMCEASISESNNELIGSEEVSSIIQESSAAVNQSEEKIVTTVKSIEQTPNSKKVKFICLTPDGRKVTVGSNQTRKLGLRINDVNVGDRLKVTLECRDTLWYGRNVDLARECAD